MIYNLAVTSVVVGSLLGIFLYEYITLAPLYLILILLTSILFMFKLKPTKLIVLIMCTGSSFIAMSTVLNNFNLFIDVVLLNFLMLVGILLVSLTFKLYGLLVSNKEEPIVGEGVIITLWVLIYAFTFSNLSVTILNKPAIIITAILLVIYSSVINLKALKDIHSIKEQHRYSVLMIVTISTITVLSTIAANNFVS